MMCLLHSSCFHMLARNRPKSQLRHQQMVPNASSKLASLSTLPSTPRKVERVQERPKPKLGIRCQQLCRACILKHQKGCLSVLPTISVPAKPAQSAHVNMFVVCLGATNSTHTSNISELHMAKQQFHQLHATRMFVVHVNPL